MKEYLIIPRPLSIQYFEGEFHCPGIPRITETPETTVFRDESGVFMAQILHTYGEEAFARYSRNSNTGTSSPVSGITLQKTGDSGAEESYRLEIRPDRIIISARDGESIFRGIQILRQLILSGYQDGTLTIPCGVIEDKPRFPWRGFMLDCSRNFFTPEFIKNLLDALSLQHINVFHWHLTDDQGWRLPVDAYPLLTEIGGRRWDNRIHRYTGGFYTKEQIKDIVSFAAQRHIDVMPEVDLPGHANSILAPYPGLGCTGGPYRVEDRFGVFEDVLCAGNDGLFDLAEAVFDTLAELFPFKYVHMGGDEVRFNRWKDCPRCQKRRVDLGLAEPAELQSWITSRLADMLRRRGKTAVGWDEILENTEKFPLPQDTVVMSWRSQEGGERAAAMGRRVIMTPQTNGCYFDYRHIDDPEEMGRLGIGTITKAYNMDPVTPEMDEKAGSYVLGGQGNLWSEVIYAGKIAEYMTFPRICAVAEALWTDKKLKDIDDFARRLETHQRRLDTLGILQYRGPLG